jgi:glutamate--cysteine ligase
VYRRGLLNRYGGMMQAIAGVHFNYSLPQDFWPVWAEVLQAPRPDTAQVSAAYFALLRNFRRHGWLISYLFGASPALCRSFLQGREAEGLQSWRGNTLYGEQATSLRMSDIGYRNRNQAAVAVSANSLADYLRDLRTAVHTPHAPFAALGVKVDGEYRQLSANVLQIENEYYSNIRPKRVPRSGELTGQALARGGVEYVEVRTLDLDPLNAASVSAPQLAFVEALLLTLLVMDSPPIGASEQEALDRNHLEVARQGRQPDLLLETAGRRLRLRAQAGALLEQMQGVCELLDAGDPARNYSRALQQQRERLQQPEDLPAALLLREMRAQDCDFATQVLQHASQARAATLALPAPAAMLEEFAAQAGESLELQARKDASVTGSFDSYLQQRLS